VLPEWRRTVGVVRRRRRNGFSPRFSAYEIGSSMVCGESCVGMTNVGSHAPVHPSFIWRCVRGADCHNNDRRPRSRRGWKSFYIREITFLTLHRINRRKQIETYPPKINKLVYGDQSKKKRERRGDDLAISVVPSRGPAAGRRRNGFGPHGLPLLQEPLQRALHGQPRRLVRPHR
jgi:hypothetical protein